jgi:hypothetical protein
VVSVLWKRRRWYLRLKLTDFYISRGTIKIATRARFFYFFILTL